MNYRKIIGSIYLEYMNPRSLSHTLLNLIDLLIAVSKKQHTFCHFEDTRCVIK